MSVTVVVGGQYGSEGKGKTVAHLASEFSLAVRTGGPNSGHTVEKAGKFYKLRSIPSAFVNPLCRLAIGAGGIIDVMTLNDNSLGVNHYTCFINSAYFDFI